MSTPSNQPVEVDLSAVQNEVGKLSDAQVREQLLAIRTRQVKQQKKMQASGSQKAYQLRARERNRLLKQRAIESGMYDEINKQAAAAADAALENEASEHDNSEE